jgi:hypothetical protein
VAGIVIPVARFAGEHGEAVVVPRRHHHVLRARILGQLCPAVRIEMLRLELIRQPGIFLGIDLVVVHMPFPFGRNGVQPPVNEDAELRILPPAHVFRRQPQFRSQLTRIGLRLQRRALFIRGVRRRRLGQALRTMQRQQASRSQ